MGWEGEGGGREGEGGRERWGRREGEVWKEVSDSGMGGGGEEGGGREGEGGREVGKERWVGKEGRKCRERG